MAFLNLWSSERLSFSLSIVAVVSAAITTYHQFYNQSTEVSCILHHNIKFPNGGGPHFNDTLAFECTFLNSGSTPVGLIESRMFISSSDSAFESQASYIGDYGSHTIQTNTWNWNQTAYFPEQSVVNVSFSHQVDTTDLRRIISIASHIDNRPEKVRLTAGVWLRMVDPFGNESTKVISVSPSYEAATLWPSVWGMPTGKIQMPPFRPRDIE